MDKEAASMQLVGDVQNELSAALNSLGGKQHGGLLDPFRFYMSSHINRAVEGYIFLRKASRLDASRILIRPAIEAMIRLVALNKDTSLLYRIAFTEPMDDLRSMKKSTVKLTKDYFLEDEKQWKEFTKHYAAEFPKQKLQEKELKLFEAAKIAGAENYYNSYYRHYCNFVHASLAAASGSLYDTHTEDNEVMAACAFCAVETIGSLGGSIPNHASLRDRLFSIGKS